MVPIRRAVRCLRDPWDRRSVRWQPLTACLVWTTGCVLSGCHRDVDSADRAPAAALRRIGARLELDPRGKITGVILTDTPLADRQLEPIAKLDMLQSLRLESTGITDAGLQHVQTLTSLRQLSLYKTHVTSAGLQYVRGLTNLQSLGLNATEVNDAGLACLSKLTNLEHLWLDGTAVSDAGVPKLLPLAQLRNLGLRETQRTRQAGSQSHDFFSSLLGPGRGVRISVFAAV
jgi:hypothetical protein